MDKAGLEPWRGGAPALMGQDGDHQLRSARAGVWVFPGPWGPGGSLVAWGLPLLALRPLLGDSPWSGCCWLYRGLDTLGTRPWGLGLVSWHLQGPACRALWGPVGPRQGSRATWAPFLGLLLMFLPRRVVCGEPGLSRAGRRACHVPWISGVKGATLAGHSQRPRLVPGQCCFLPGLRGAGLSVGGSASAGAAGRALTRSRGVVQGEGS